MKRIRKISAIALFAIGALAFFNAKDAEATCVNCTQVANDGNCYLQVCQTIISEGWACNMYRSQLGNCDPEN